LCDVITLCDVINLCDVIALKAMQIQLINEETGEAGPVFCSQVKAAMFLNVFVLLPSVYPHSVKPGVFFLHCITSSSLFCRTPYKISSLTTARFLYFRHGVKGILRESLNW
jgi:hypothetical protein